MWWSKTLQCWCNKSPIFPLKKWCTSCSSLIGSSSERTSSFLILSCRAFSLNNRKFTRVLGHRSAFSLDDFINLSFYINTRHCSLTWMLFLILQNFLFKNIRINESFFVHVFFHHTYYVASFNEFSAKGNGGGHVCMYVAIKGAKTDLSNKLWPSIIQRFSTFETNIFIHGNLCAMTTMLHHSCHGSNQVCIAPTAKWWSELRIIAQHS